MKTISNKDNNYSLNNLENYKKNIDNEISEITEKYYQLLLEYFKFIIENIKIKNTDFSRFIIERGLDTITNVFNNLLYYTRNIDLTFFHCQKSFYFYVEFVGQISEDEKMFLQLTSRDATTYVYKKTIFEINNEYRKNINENTSQETNNKLKFINNYVNIYKTFIYKIIHNENFIENTSYIENFDKICEKINKLKITKENIAILNNILDNMYFTINDLEYYFDLIQIFIKKIKNYDLKKCEEKINTNEFQERLNDKPDKFVMWLLC